MEIRDKGKYNEKVISVDVTGPNDHVDTIFGWLSGEGRRTIKQPAGANRADYKTCLASRLPKGPVGDRYNLETRQENFKKGLA